ncbi:MAG: hypothetical protein WBL74_03595 [Novosphingobium sp.]|uniref:hypothetical protein n=1 Tax=Novosphingobium sp. TaxID=1874826 RepID=UPI003C7A7455
MKRIFLGFAAVIAAFAASPALALTAEQVACPASQLPGDLNASLDRTFSAAGTKADFDRTRTAIAAAVVTCSSDLAIPPADASALANYTLGKVGSARAAQLLKERCIPAGIIDLTLDIGEGATNPDRTRLSEDDWQALDAAFVQSGFDAGGLTADDRRLIDGYAALTTLYWSTKGRIGL